MIESTNTDVFYRLRAPMMAQEFLVKGDGSRGGLSTIKHPENALSLDALREILRYVVLQNVTGRRILLDSNFIGINFNNIETGYPSDSPDHTEVLKILYDSCLKLQKALARLFAENGNDVFFQRYSFKDIMRPRRDRRVWTPSSSRDGRVLKHYDENTTSLKKAVHEPVVTPDHPNLVSEKYFPLVTLEEMSVGTVGTAPDLSDIFTLCDVKKSLSLIDRLSVVVDAMKGCECWHQHGFVHRDVKPENIMVFGDTNDAGCEGLVGKLADHELVTRISSPSSADDPDGTPCYSDYSWYLGSYRRRGGYDVTPSVDVFSFAVTLLKMYLPADVSEGIIQRLTVEILASPDLPKELFSCESFGELAAVIPEDDLRLISDMMRFRQSERPQLKDVIDFYQKKYKF